MKTKLSLIALTIFNISACSNQLPRHVDVGCLGLPQVNVIFTQLEADSMLDSAVDKIVLMRETYKARINAQCDINIKHDQLMNQGK